MPVNTNDINDKGGNKIAVIELDENYAIVENLSEGTNCLDLGHIASSEVELKANKEEYKSEDGVIRQTSYEYMANTSGILMEINKTAIDFLCFTVRDKMYLEYKYLGIRGGKHQEIFKVVKITPQMKVTAPGGAKSMPYESTAIVPMSSVMISADDIVAIRLAIAHVGIRTPGPVTIAANTEFVLVETGVN
ncbi:MAG: hypothetical protein EHM58_03125 [Ignavibacteriae bacterium]|nr:MAG: hypothetical protein EHM58_03125 [Ignavibacteriota bacterium]